MKNKQYVVTFLNAKGVRDSDVVPFGLTTSAVLYAAANYCDAVSDFFCVGEAPLVYKAAEHLWNGGARIAVVQDDCGINAEGFAAFVNAKFVDPSEENGGYDFFRELGRQVLEGKDIPLVVTTTMFHFVENHEQTFHGIYTNIRGSRK